MEINKQLFEDVLSGKLKGTFVLRNKQIAKSNTLKRSCIDNFPYEMLITYDNGVTGYGAFKSNGEFETFNISRLDIINFIPDTNMKENELTIEIPDGKIVDWDESKKQNKIVLKDKQLTYEDVCNRLQNMIDITLFNTPTPSKQGNVLVADVHQLECIIAKNMLANVAKYLNNGWKPSKTDFGQFICACGEELEIRDRNDYKFNNNIIFKTKELAKKAIEILGEETIKLALESLGI